MQRRGDVTEGGLSGGAPPSLDGGSLKPWTHLVVSPNIILSTEHPYVGKNAVNRMNTFSQPHSIQNTFCEFVQFFVNSKYVFVNLVIITN